MKNYLVFFLLCGMIQLVSAQKHLIGLKGGFMSSSIKMDDWVQGPYNWLEPYNSDNKRPEFKPIRRTFFSLGYTRQLIGKVFAGTGIELYNKGSIMRMDSSYSDVYGQGYSEYKTTRNLTLSYLSVPLLIQRAIHLTKNGKHQVLIYAGMNLNYLVRAYSQSSSTIHQINAIYYTDTTYKIHQKGPDTGFYRLGYSGFVGAGYTFQFHEGIRIGIDYRYVISPRENINKFFYKEAWRYQAREDAPIFRNSNNHVLSVAIYMTPKLFLGTE